MVKVAVYQYAADVDYRRDKRKSKVYSSFPGKRESRKQRGCGESELVRNRVEPFVAVKKHRRYKVNKRDNNSER